MATMLTLIRLNNTTVPHSNPPPRSGSRQACRVSCSHSQESSRRSVSIALLIFNCISIPTPPHAFAASDGLLDRYVKRKRLDPLDVYVPPVLLTQFQIKDLEKTLEGDQPQYASCRSVLRSGPAASLRVNIRAVAQYASDSGQGKAATDDVDQCLRALEDLDSLLLRASRNDQQASVGLMKAKIVVALGALDSLLQTVPSPILDKGKAIADAYRVTEDDEPQKLDPEMKQLEALL